MLGRKPEHEIETLCLSPHLCVGFLFLILYPSRPPPPPPPPPPPQLCHTPSFTHNFVTHTLSFTHTTLSHTIFLTQLCHTLSFTHNFVTHHLSHTTLSHTHTHHLSHIFHTQLCPIPSYTHNFVTHHLSHNFVTHSLSHTTLSHTIFHTQLCHTPSFTHHLGDIYLHFAWPRVALMTLGWLRWRAWSPSFCMAGVALHDITVVSCGRRGTWRVIDHRFVWHVWQCLTETFGKTFWHVYRDAWCEPCLALFASHV